MRCVHIFDDKLNYIAGDVLSLPMKGVWSNDEIKSMVDIGKDELGSGAELSPFRLPMYEVEG